MRKLFITGVAVFAIMAFLSFVTFAAVTNTALDGKISITDESGTGKWDGDAYTITVSAKSSATTNTITICNETSAEATVGFDYSVSNQTAFTIDGVSVAASGTHSAAIEAGGIFEISMTTKGNFIFSKTATLTLTNFSYIEKGSSVNVTVAFDSTLGTVTADGVQIEDCDKVTIGETAVELTATPASGAKFIAWVEENGTIITEEATCSQRAFVDKTIKALFSQTTPYFKVDNTRIFDDLNEAAQAGKKIVLMCDGILEEGFYQIPSGATLLIPFDDANTEYTTEPVGVAEYTTPSAYRTLTMAEGAEIEVNGAISIPAKHSAKQGLNGAVTGPYGHINMETGSTITVNSGGNLYAWGYITGSGSVIAKNGAKIYECFQVTDWRGGNATSGMVSKNTNRVFPMSQYYVQNIEVPLTLEAGAVENGYMSVEVTLIGVKSSEVPFIGTNGMFNIVSGSVVKDYDEEHDRLIIDVNGELEMKAMSISMTITIGLPTTINSAEYVLPINGNITLNINNGGVVNVTQDMALLPGGVINVHEGGECIFATGSEAFIYGSADWGAYCGHLNYVFAPVSYANRGSKATRTEANLVDAEVRVEGTVNALDGKVYTTQSGANIWSDGGGVVMIKPDATAHTYQATQSGTDISYVAIPITTAKLKNDDGGYVSPIACYPVYESKNGVWTPVEDEATHTNIVVTPGVEPTCTETGLSESSHCSACNTVIVPQTTLPSLGHSIVNHAAQAQTCEEIGWNAYESCSRCDYTTYAELPALGHDPVSHEAQPQTCEGIGWNAYETCSRCDYTTYAELSALGHDPISHEAQPQTCEEIGWKAYETCSRCDYTTYAELEALGHSYDCVEISETEHKKTCKNDPAHVLVEEHTYDGLRCFACGNKKMVTDTECTVEAESIFVEIDMTRDVPYETQIIVATYDEDGRMCSVSARKAYSSGGFYMSAEGISTIVVYAWDGINMTLPLAYAEEIIINK